MSAALSLTSRWSSPRLSTRLADGAALRTEFLARFGAARDALHARLDATGIRHVAHVLDEAVDLPLRRLFAALGTVD